MEKVWRVRDRRRIRFFTSMQKLTTPPTMQACHPLSPKALLHALLPDETESPPQSPEPSPYRLQRDSSSAPSEQPIEHTDLSAIVRRLSHNSEQISRILVDDRSGSVSPHSSRSSNGESPIESPPALTPTRLARRRSDPSPLGQPWVLRGFAP